MSLFESKRLIDAGPHGFRRLVQRLMVQWHYEVFSVDGPGDEGGDLYCERDGERVIIQCKWKKTGAISRSVIDETLNAYRAYNAHTAIIATNGNVSKQVRSEIERLRKTGVEIHLWDTYSLKEFSSQLDQWMPAKELRLYQAEAVTHINQDLKENNRASIYLATGMGKTVVAGAIVREFLQSKPDAKILVMAHMIDLVEQLHTAFWQDIPNSFPSQIVDGQNKPELLDGLLVGVEKSISEYVFDGYQPDLVIIDECHHVGASNLYSKILDHLGDVPLLGVTATPWRGDSFSISNRFGEPSYVCGIETGMAKGHLAPVDYRLFCDNINWDEIPSLSENEYSIKELNRRLFLPERDDKLISELLKTWNEVSDPKGIIFCQSIAHANEIVSILRRYDQWKSAEVIHSELDKKSRRQALIRFRSKDCPILISVDILNEGVDVPNVNIVCFARVTHSRKIFVQQLGRGLRLAPNKEKVIVLDFAADIRRMAAISSLSTLIEEERKDVERLDTQNPELHFTNQAVESLMKEWIKDAADLETSDDESRLQFPDLSS